MKPLLEQRCEPRSGAAHRLSSEQVRDLLAQLPGWQAEDGLQAIHKSWTFKNFYQTMSFANGVAHIANSEDHHPDLTLSYGRCTVRYNTHDVGGLSLNDFICAARIEALYSPL